MGEHNPATILFVDDDAHSRRTLGCLIRAAGYSLVEAGTGHEALQLCLSHRPDLVILDVNLPDLSGFEVCRRLKEDPANQALSVVHLSAVFVGPGDRTLGLEGGADAYLVKPVEPRELLATVRALLRIRAAEEAARRAAQEWRTTFDAISDVVCLLDASGRVCRCNKALCELAGRTFHEVVGRSLDDVLHQGLGLEQAPRLAPPADRPSHDSREVHLAGRWFLVTVDPIRDVGPAGTGSVVILTDVTARKRLEERLQQAQRLEAVGRLAGGVAHEFNNLLTAILGNASLLLAALRPEQREHQLVGTVERAAWRAAELTRQLLGFSRQTLLWLRPVDPAALLDTVVTALGRSLPATVRLTVHRPPRVGSVHADPAQIEQILAALCRNAVEAMPQGGRLLLEATDVDLSDEAVRGNPEARPGSFVRLRVQDSGPGIPADVLDKIFDPFFTTKPVGRGSGLGLAMVYGILKQHQGWVECHSDPSCDTRFDLYLPRSQADVAPGPPAPIPPPRLVLLADDNDALRALAGAYLQQGGFHVLLAADGQEAVDLFRSQQDRIDLVILDQVMPHLTGRDALEQMRRIKPSLRALVASGSPGVELPRPAEGLGVVTKPYRERELLQAVHRILGQPAASA
jgi:PAS domain S-box-containing protein